MSIEQKALLPLMGCLENEIKENTMFEGTVLSDSEKAEKIRQLKLEQIAHLVGSIFFAGNFKVETHNEAALDELLKQVGAHYTTWEQCEQGTEKLKTNEIEYEFRGVRKVWG